MPTGRLAQSEIALRGARAVVAVGVGDHHPGSAVEKHTLGAGEAKCADLRADLVEVEGIGTIAPCLDAAGHGLNRAGQVERQAFVYARAARQEMGSGNAIDCKDCGCDDHQYLGKRWESEFHGGSPGYPDQVNVAWIFFLRVTLKIFLRRSAWIVRLLSAFAGAQTSNSTQAGCPRKACGLAVKP